MKKVNCSKNVIVVVVAVLLILSIFGSIPLYFFITEYALSSDSSTNATEVSINVTTTCNGSTRVITVCDTHGIADTLSGCSSSDECSANVYTGSVCLESLLAWQECAISDIDDTLYISLSKEQTESENDAEIFVSYLGLASKECQAAVLPLFCLYTFPICDCATTRLYQPTRESCELIRDETCSSEWFLVNSVNPDILPDCSNLPNARAETIDESSGCFNETNGDSTDDEQNFTCRYDFIQQNNTCWPRCDRFSQFPERITKALEYVIFVATSLGTLLALAVIIFGLVDYKKVFAFPLAFLMFLLFDYLIFAVFSFVSVIGRPGLYCSDIRLDESYRNPTFFCILTGAVFHYMTVQMALWWFSYIAIFFFNVVFPFHSRNLRNTKEMKMIYAFIVLAGLFLPLPAVMACLIDDDHLGYVQNDFPTTVCTSKNYNFWFYSNNLLSNILLAVGSVLLIIIIVTIHKHQGFFKEKKGRLTGIIHVTTPVEKKLLALFIFFICFGVIGNIYAVVTGANRNELATAFQKYFACEAQGYKPGRCDRSEIEFVHLSYFGILTFISFGLVPSFALSFVLNWRKLKNCVKKPPPTSVTTRKSSVTSMNSGSLIGRKISKMSNLSFNALYSISEEPTNVEAPTVELFY